MSIRSLSAITVTNIYQSFTYKMAAEISWDRYGTKLRHCHLMYIHLGHVRYRRRKHLKSGRARQSVSLVSHQRPTTILNVEGKSSRAERAKKLYTGVDGP